jgi:hypothetical protein
MFIRKLNMWHWMLYLMSAMFIMYNLSLYYKLVLYFMLVKHLLPHSVQVSYVQLCK